MTTIVLSTKERAVCSDRQVTFTDMPLKVAYRNKIQRIRTPEGIEILLASAGNIDSTIPFEIAFREAKESGKPIKLNLSEKTLKKISAFAYYSDGLIEAYDGGIEPIPIETPYYGIGSGSPYAIGALFNGASLKEAVRIATLCDPWSGLGITYETFSNSKARTRTNNRKTVSTT